MTDNDTRKPVMRMDAYIGAMIVLAPPENVSILQEGDVVLVYDRRMVVEAFDSTVGDPFQEVGVILRQCEKTPREVSLEKDDEARRRNNYTPVDQR